MLAAVTPETVNSCFENRELSWLRFNERVLEEAEDARVPFCERLSFLSIFQSNLDEFFMVRIGSLHDQMLLDGESRENKTNMTPEEQLNAALARIGALCARRDAAYRDLMALLEEQGIRIASPGQLGEDARRRMKKYFTQEMMPLLSPIVVGKRQAFPFLTGRAVYAAALITENAGKEKSGKDKAAKEKKEKKTAAQLVLVPRSNLLPPIVEVPEHKGCFVLTEDLLLHHLPLLFRGCRVESAALLRVTRNADIDAVRIYDEDLNYRDHMAEVVKRRRKLSPVRLELRGTGVETAMRKKLCRALQLEEKRAFFAYTPLDLSFLSMMKDELRNRAALFYAPRHPQASIQVDEKRPMIEQIEQQDILLYHPYESIRPFLRLLNEAAHDPTVVSIKMTLYRLARQSKVVEALAEAAENGKQVDVLVELQARFDEENNIEWSRRLEKAGCHVIYGLEGLKVHSKLCLILRRTEEGISMITQIGTGNYNEITAQLYTDLSLMTANPDIGEDAASVFRSLALGETVDHVQHLMVAPHCLQNKVLDLIDGEIRAAKRGEQAYIGLKLNSLTDKTIMDKLVEASCAGVQIEMVVRGICCLRAGVPGCTENIHVISIVGRYLEHARIYIFGRGARARYYIASADFMTRNTLRRVEVAAPIWSEPLKEQLQQIFTIMLEDNVCAREQQPDGRYLRRMPGDEQARNSQTIFYDTAYRRAAARQTRRQLGET